MLSSLKAELSVPHEQRVEPEVQPEVHELINQMAVVAKQRTLNLEFFFRVWFIGTRIG